MPHDYMSQFLKSVTRQQLIKEQKNSWKFLLNQGQKLDREASPTFIANPKNLNIGQMYLYVYSAKWKAKLPYYDAHPLIFPINISGDRFMGINFHYLPIGARVKLMDALYDFSDKNDPESLMISYNILRGAAKYRYFKPCVHVYLNSWVRSTFLTIPSSQWKKALLLPTQRFQGAKSNWVYRDSINKY
jgi:hypothetical protein